MLNSNHAIRSALAVFVLASAVAHAADSDKNKGDAPAPAPVRSAGVATFGQLDELRSQNAILEASIKNNELRSKLAGSKGAPAAPGGSGTFISPQAPQAPAAAVVSDNSASSVASSAEVLMVASDADSNLVAVISLQNGRKVKARVGSEIPGLGVIKSITIDEVVAVVAAGKKSKLVSLPFASEPTMGPTLNPMNPMQLSPSFPSALPPIPVSTRGGR